VGFDAFNPRRLSIIKKYIPEKGSEITGCSNSGSISGGRAAGIVGTLGVTPGQAQPDDPTVLTKIYDCTNTGAISGTAGKCGAIFGYQITYANGDGDEYVNHLLVQISGCYAYGTVNGETATVNTSSPYLG
jgi:hypothetical protein